MAKTFPPTSPRRRRAKSNKTKNRWIILSISIIDLFNYDYWTEWIPTSNWIEWIPTSNHKIYVYLNVHTNKYMFTIHLYGLTDGSSQHQRNEFTCPKRPNLSASQAASTSRRTFSPSLQAALS